MSNPPRIVMLLEQLWTKLVLLALVSIVGLLEIVAAFGYLWSRLPFAVRQTISRVATWFADNRPAQYMLFIEVLVLTLALLLACIWRFILGRR